MHHSVNMFFILILRAATVKVWLLLHDIVSSLQKLSDSRTLPGLKVLHLLKEVGVAASCMAKTRARPFC